MDNSMGDECDCGCGGKILPPYYEGENLVPNAMDFTMFPEMAVFSDDNEFGAIEQRASKWMIWLGLICAAGLLALGSCTPQEAVAAPHVMSKCVHQAQDSHEAQVHQALGISKFVDKQAQAMLSYAVKVTEGKPDEYQVPVSALAVAWDNEIVIAFYSANDCRLPQIFHVDYPAFKLMMQTLSPI